MNDRNHVLGAVGAFVAVFLVGALVLAWPSHRQARAIRHDIADLHTRIAALDASTAEVEKLAASLTSAQRIVDEDLRIVPESPDLGELMRRLSLRVDGETVIDQTFAAGGGSAIALAAPRHSGRNPRNDEETEEPKPHAMPLNIDLVGTFDSVFAMLKATESIERLVRISSVRLSADRKDEAAGSSSGRSGGSPVLNASIGLEAIYLPQEARREAR